MQRNEKEINRSKESLISLQEIEYYIAKDNSKAASEFIDKIIAIAQTLVLHPRKGRVVPEIVIDSIRELLFKNYRIVYHIKEKSIVILTVFEGHKLLNEDEIINVL